MMADVWAASAEGKEAVTKWVISDASDQLEDVTERRRLDVIEQLVKKYKDCEYMGMIPEGCIKVPELPNARFLSLAISFATIMPIQDVTYTNVINYTHTYVFNYEGSYMAEIFEVAETDRQWVYDDIMELIKFQRASIA